MTNNEVNQILADTKKLINSMDREHVEKMFQILISIPKESDTDTLYAPTLLRLSDLRKVVKQVISNCIDSPHSVDCLTHKQMKQIYEIVGDYNYYPVCQLCGTPIKINSKTAKQDTMSFTWDHIFPKSLGGTTNLRNLQPAHKYCNNLKGSKVPNDQHVHYNISININMQYGCLECPDCYNKQKKKKTKQALRKQDSWCHKARHFHHR